MVKMRYQVQANFQKDSDNNIFFLFYDSLVKFEPFNEDIPIIIEMIKDNLERQDIIDILGKKLGKGNVKHRLKNLVALKVIKPATNKVQRMQLCVLGSNPLSRRFVKSAKTFGFSISQIIPESALLKGKLKHYIQKRAPKDSIVIAFVSHRPKKYTDTLTTFLFEKRIRWINIISWHDRIIATPLLGYKFCYGCYETRYLENSMEMVKSLASDKESVISASMLVTSRARILFQILLDQIHRKEASNTLAAWDEIIEVSRYGESQKKKLQRVPYCKVCGQSEFHIIDSKKAAGSKPASKLRLKKQPIVYRNNGLRSGHPQDFLEKYAPVVSNMGLLHDMEYMKDSVSELDIPVLRISSNPSLQHMGNDFDQSIIHAGKGSSDRQARVSCIAEGLERYCAKLHGGETLIDGTYEALRQYCVPFEDFGIKEDPRFPYRKERLYWTWVQSLTDNRYCLVPGHLVYLPYFENRNGTYRPFKSHSNGLSIGANYEEAILQAILEVIERDTFTITHNVKIPGYPIPESEITSFEVQAVMEHLKGVGFEIHLFDITLDIPICTVCAILEYKPAKGNIPVFSDGFGTHLDRNIAINRAVTEAIQIRMAQFLNAEELKTDKEHREESVSSFFEFQIIWNRKLGEQAYGYMFNNERKRPKCEVVKSNDIKAYINKTLELLQRHHADVYIADLTREHVGLPVVKVIIPQLQSVYEYLVSKRLLRFKKQFPRRAST